MGSDDLLSRKVSTTYHRAYELATELTRGGQHPVACGYRASLAEDWMINAMLAQVLPRLDRGSREDPALILMAVRDVLHNTRSAAPRLTGDTAL